MDFFKKGNVVKGAKAVKVRNFDRSFILLGKGSAGKSTLGNLLLGGKPFKEHDMPEAFGVTVKVHSGETEIESSLVYDLNGHPNQMLNIQVLDQPGLNDHDFKQKHLCEFLTKCIAASKAEMSASFLILIKLSAAFFSSEELLTILNLAEILSDGNYNFFSNAMIVFTHADELPDYLEGETFEEKFDDLLDREDFECVQELIDLVDGRYIFINAKDGSENNRVTTLQKLFKLTRPNLTVYINGNNGFRGNELKQLFGEDEYEDSFEKNLLKQDVEYHFNPDLNIFKKHEKRDLDDDIANALDKLSGISKGISAMVLLISLEEVFNQAMLKLILNLPKTYNLGEGFKKDFWDYACIMFKVPDDSEECVKKNITRNKLLQEINLKVKSRYSWVTKKTSPEECSRRLTDLVRKVKLDAEGKTYTDRVVLTEMRQRIRGAGRLKRSRRAIRMSGRIDDEDLRRDIPFYQSHDGSKVMVEANGFFWDKEEISPMIGYFILKNINPDIAEEFKEKYPDKDAKIPTRKYTDYCIKAMEKK